MHSSRCAWAYYGRMADTVTPNGDTVTPAKAGAQFLVNGVARTTPADPSTPLLYALRNDLGLAGTRFGCGTEQCGACLVLVDGAPRYACTLTVGEADGKEIVTIEGLARDGEPNALQRAFLAEN